MPTDITTKELTALEDQLNMESIMIAKCNSLAEQCTDQALQQKFRQYATKHQNHFDTLMGHLQ